MRIYQAYGPKQDFNRFIPITIRASIKDLKFPCSIGNQYRDFTYVDDIVRAIILSLRSLKSKGKIINIASGKPTKIKDIIELIRNKLKRGKPQYGLISLRKDEILKVYPSLQNAKKLIKWNAKTSFEKGLNKTIKFYLRTIQ